MWLLKFITTLTFLYSAQSLSISKGVGRSICDSYSKFKDSQRLERVSSDRNEYSHVSCGWYFLERRSCEKTCSTFRPKSCNWDTSDDDLPPITIQNDENEKRPYNQDDRGRSDENYNYRRPNQRTVRGDDQREWNIHPFGYSIREHKEPCECGDSPIGGCFCYDGCLLECVGKEVNQQSIERMFSEIRSKNGISQTQWLEVPSLMIKDSALETFDLTPLQYTRIIHFWLEENAKLSKLEGATPRPKLPNQLTGFIDTLIFAISSSLLLNDDGVGQSLFFFTDNMTEFTIEYGAITGGKYGIQDGADGIEFLTWLSKFTKINGLHFNGNRIWTIGGGQFQKKQCFQNYFEF